MEYISETLRERKGDFKGKEFPLDYLDRTLPFCLQGVAKQALLLAHSLKEKAVKDIFPLIVNAKEALLCFQNGNKLNRLKHFTHLPTHLIGKNAGNKNSEK